MTEILSVHITDIPLKGTRSYLQSADIWNAVAVAVRQGNIGDWPLMRITFRRFAETVPRLILFAPGDRPSNAPRRFADVILFDGESRILGHLEETEEEVIKRIDYPEENLREFCRFDEGELVYNGPRLFSEVEIIISLVKYLHEQKVSDEVRWLATRIHLPLALNYREGDCMRVKLAQKVYGMATESEISMAGIKLGSVHFYPVNA